MTLKGTKQKGWGKRLVMCLCQLFICVCLFNTKIATTHSRVEKQHHHPVTGKITTQRHILLYLTLRMHKCCKNIHTWLSTNSACYYRQVYKMQHRFYSGNRTQVVITSCETEAQLAWPVKMEGTGQRGLEPGIWGVHRGDPGGCERGGGGPLPCHTLSASLPSLCATQPEEQTSGLETAHLGINKHISVIGLSRVSCVNILVVSGFTSCGHLRVLTVAAR